MKAGTTSTMNNHEGLRSASTEIITKRKDKK
jgi:hypothetical protein